MRTRVSRPVAAITEMPLPTLLGHGGPGGGHSAQGRSHASHRARRHSVTTPSATRRAQRHAPRPAPLTTPRATQSPCSAIHRAQPLTAPRATHRAQRHCHSPCRCRNGAAEWRVRRGASGGRRPEQSAEGGEGSARKENPKSKVNKVNKCCLVLRENVRAVTDTHSAADGRLTREAGGARAAQRADFSKHSSHHHGGTCAPAASTSPSRAVRELLGDRDLSSQHEAREHCPAKANVQVAPGQ